MPQEMTAYANFKQYSLRYNLERAVFNCWYTPQGCIVADAGITQVRHGEKTFAISDYASVSFTHSQQDGATGLAIHYANGPEEQRDFQINFLLTDRGIRCTFGWGTNLTNDLGFPALSLVIKTVKEIVNNIGMV